MSINFLSRISLLLQTILHHQMKTEPNQNSEAADTSKQKKNKILQLLQGTVTICEKLCAQLVRKINSFKESIERHQDEVDPKTLIHFLQYTMWMYVKFKYGVYPSCDNSLPAFFGTTDRLQAHQLSDDDWYHLEKEKIGALITDLTQDHFRLSKGKGYTFVRYCWNFFQYTVKETMTNVDLNGKVSKFHYV